MPIRMKEWGMKASPAQGVQVPLSGIAGMDEAARSVARSIAAAGENAGKIMQMHEQIVATGESAALQTAVGAAAQRAKDDLLNAPAVPDWETAWNEAVTPLVEPLLENIPERRREGARRFVQQELHHASLNAKREREIKELRDARRQWQSSVSSAAKQGDAKTALERLEEGRDVFVPEGEMENRRREVQSLSLAESWRSRLLGDPVSALADWRAGDREQPAEESDRLALSREMAETHCALRRRLGAEYAQSVMQGVPPSADSLAGAAKAGLVEPVSSAPLRPLTAQEELEWMRRAENCGADADARADLQLRLATLAAPLPQRRRLMEYLEGTRDLPQAARRELQTELRNLYDNGAFGCVGDAVPQQRMARLMQEGNRLLAEGDAEATTKWLNGLRHPEQTWLCFEA